MKIYFAHGKIYYDTEYELNCLNKIKELYPTAEIINPKDIILDEEDKETKDFGCFMRQMNKYYFPTIKKCDILIVAKNKSGKLYGGTQKEIIYAIEIKIKVEYLNIPYPEPNKETKICHICGKQFIYEIGMEMPDPISGDGWDYACKECLNKHGFEY